MKYYVRAVIYSFSLFILFVAKSAFAISFSTIETNDAIGSESQTISMLGNPGASVADFFANQNAHPVANPMESGLGSTETSSLPTLSDYVPDNKDSIKDTSETKEDQSNNSLNTLQGREEEITTWEERGASSDSASAQLGVKGTIVGSVGRHSLQGSSLYAVGGSRQNALNRGAILLPIFLMLILFFLIRRIYPRRGAYRKNFYEKNEGIHSREINNKYYRLV